MVDLTRVLDGLTTSVLIADIRQNVLHLNGSAETLLGVSRNQGRGKPVKDLLRAGSDIGELLDRASTTWQSFSRRELTIRPAATGEELVVDCAVVPFEEPGAQPAL